MVEITIVTFRARKQNIEWAWKGTYEDSESFSYFPMAQNDCVGILMLYDFINAFRKV